MKRKHGKLLTAMPLHRMLPKNAILPHKQGIQEMKNTNAAI